MNAFLKAGSLLAAVLVVIPGIWRTFAKAGRPGWTGLVPFLNLYLLCRMGETPGWWSLLLAAPGLNLVVWFIICWRVARAFGQGLGVALLLAVVPVVGFPVLGFGRARYRGAAGLRPGLRPDRPWRPSRRA
jgi:hypothetical protein